ncbi:MAG: amino acid permease [Chloroflexota bacterium]
MENETAESQPSGNQPAQLQRTVGFWGAILLGLGSMIGTGVFVSIGIGASITGASVILAVIIGAGVAICNGLSSAQLAANHPVSGGTYEYGYRYLTPWLGFIAGWMFLLAKSASAATGALGFSGYLLTTMGLEMRWLQIGLALVAVAGLTWIVLTGIRRSNIANTIIVGITLAVLLFFVVAGVGSISNNGVAGGIRFMPLFGPSEPSNAGGFAAFISALRQFLYASALMFVAYTGYGRIATLGEEVKEPARTIPRAIITTMIITMVLYISVAVVAIGTLGAEGLGQATLDAVAPLEVAARTFGIGWAPLLIAIGAITAMLGVLLNLILGLSRVLLAMGRRGDMPSVVATLDPSGSTPTVAVIVMAVVIGLLVLVGNVQTTWSFSAFTVLVYYALTNLSALQLADTERLYPRWISWAGLTACILLAFLVEPQIWFLGLSLLAVGLLWHFGIKLRS